jgi:predicted lipid-binding transport protein (Tim44 family)
MKIPLIIFVLLTFLGVTLGHALAQQQGDFVIYPSQGQSAKKMEQDKFECYGWAKEQTGFDPMATPTATTPPPPASKSSVGGGMIKGGAVGALAGVGIGAIAGDAGKGAAIGAVAGGVLGGVRSKRQQEQEQQAQQQWANDQASQYQQKRDYYNRAYKACLVGRGYTVQ